MAIVRETGAIRRLRILHSGCIYTHGIPPEVVITSPPPGPESRRAKGKAVLDGKGGVKEVILTDHGVGYRTNRPVTVTFLPRGEGEAEEQLRLEAGGETCPGGARAVAVLDKEISRIDLLDGGSGYVVPIGAEVEIEAPAELDGHRATATAVVKPTVTMSGIGTKYNSASISAQLQQLLPSDTGRYLLCRFISSLSI